MKAFETHVQLSLPFLAHTRLRTHIDNQEKTQRASPRTVNRPSAGARGGGCDFSLTVEKDVSRQMVRLMISKASPPSSSFTFRVMLYVPDEMYVWVTVLVSVIGFTSGDG